MVSNIDCCCFYPKGGKEEFSFPFPKNNRVIPGFFILDVLSGPKGLEHCNKVEIVTDQCVQMALLVLIFLL